MASVRAKPAVTGRHARKKATRSAEAPASSRPLQAVDRKRDQSDAVDEEVRERRHARLRRLGIGAGMVTLAGVLIYGVFPIRDYGQQRQARDRAREQLDVLSRENDRLARRASELRTDEMIEEIARDHGLVMPGEESYAVLPPPQAVEGSRED